MAKLALGVAALTTLAVMVACFAVARSDKALSLASMPAIASSALAWGAGVLLAFAAAAHAFRRDREDGVRALLQMRGRSETAYLWARVAGLSVRLALVVGGGTVLVGAVAALLAKNALSAARTVEATGAAVLFSAAFAATLGPLAMATLGARSRAGGYAILALVLGLPTLLEGWSNAMLPSGWGELASIPGAMLALRSALLPHSFDPWRVARAAAVLALVVLIALVFARLELARADAEASR
jgi:hypothetical protein